jgi:hypothetical protein
MLLISRVTLSSGPVGRKAAAQDIFILRPLHENFKNFLFASSACTFNSHIWKVDRNNIFCWCIWHFMVLVRMYKILS